MLCGLLQSGLLPASSSTSRSFAASRTSTCPSDSATGRPIRELVRVGPVEGRRGVMAAEARFIRLTIPARPEYITLGRLALTAIAGVHSVSDETLHDLKLALTEACTNSVQHAYQDGRVGTVEILYALEPDRLAVEVADQGPGFDVAEDGNGGDGDELSESGLGIAIIRALADEVEIGPRDDGGSRLRFVKLLTD